MRPPGWYPAAACRRLRMELQSRSRLDGLGGFHDLHADGAQCARRARLGMRQNDRSATVAALAHGALEGDLAEQRHMQLIRERASAAAAEERRRLAAGRA